MRGPYGIVIADEDPKDLAFLRECLVGAGHHIVVDARSREELISCRGATSVDLIIVDVNLPGMDGIAGISKILEHEEIPVIIISRGEIDLVINHVDSCRAFAYLQKPIREQELKAAIVIARQRFHEFRAVQEEATSIRQALEDRKVIERAKGILMRERAIDEAAAFSHLQKLARRHRQKLIEVAKSINLAEQAIRGDAADEP
jgi:response regulator NasT